MHVLADQLLVAARKLQHLQDVGGSHGVLKRRKSDSSRDQLQRICHRGLSAAISHSAASFILLVLGVVAKAFSVYV